jgi:uncharacterized protein (DUF885 family)
VAQSPRQFDLRDPALLTGSVPLSVLEQAVERYITFAKGQ